MALRTLIALALGLLAPFALGSQRALASDFYGRCHFPTFPGNTWDYSGQSAGASGEATLTFLPFQGNVNGTATWILRGTGGPGVETGEEHFTNDESGIRLHRSDFFDVAVEFVPPVLAAPADGRIGESFVTQGQFVIQGIGSLPYTATATVVGRQQIQAPAGVFDTIRVDLTLQVSGSIQGVPISLTETDRTWYALDVGIVRSEKSAFGSAGGIPANESLTLQLLDYQLAGPCDDFDHEAYLAANPDLLAQGVCDESTARAHWLGGGRDEGRSFDPGALRSDLPGFAPDPGYAISGGFAWQYEDGRTVVFISEDAPKPPGWAGADLLLARCQTFDLGPTYTADAYASWNPDVAVAVPAVEAFESVTDHYVKYGFKEGRIATDDWTSVELDTWNDPAYLAANPDVAAFFEQAKRDGWLQAPQPGFGHWVNFGQYEGRDDGQTLFLAYLAGNPDLLDMLICDKADARDHWRAFGEAMGRGFASGQLRSDRPDEAPDPQYAISGGFAWEYQDGSSAVFVTESSPLPDGWAGCNPLLARCQTFGLGDYVAADYLSLNPDLASIDAGELPEFVSVTDHFAKYGFKEGRRATQAGWQEADLQAWSDPGYFAANPDVADFFAAAASCGWSQTEKPGFGHWINFGRSEGRDSGQ